MLKYLTLEIPSLTSTTMRSQDSPQVYNKIFMIRVTMLSLLHSSKRPRVALDALELNSHFDCYLYFIFTHKESFIHHTQNYEKLFT